MTQRLAIGPANFAGQGFAWAEAVQRHLGVPAISFATNTQVPLRRGMGNHRFDVHHRLPHHRLSTSWGKAIRLGRILRDVTHVAADGFLSLYGRHDRADLECDLRRLERRGIEIAMIAHGSDIRDPDAHMARHLFSFYGAAPPEWVDSLRRRSRRNRSLAQTYGAPLFVSTPDLLLDAPHATWLPLCVDPGQWSGARPAFSDEVPTVLFVPSRRHPPIKGTEVVDPVLRRLAAEGKIKYRAPDFVAHDAMPTLVQRADIVVDQIMTGSYGVAAVEGMAAARLVVGFVGAETTALMPEKAPIVDAPPWRFEAVIDDILRNPRTYADQAAGGPAFVRRWHSGEASATALGAFLGTRTAARAG
jgi:hypothetical protein